MANVDINNHLLAAALDVQFWDPVDAVPDTDRYLRALSGQQPLTAAERKQLWLSPTARCFFFDAREIRQREIAGHWQSGGFQTSGRRLAADGGDQDRALVRTADFELSLQRDDTDPAHPEWLLRLTLEQRLLETLAAGQFGVAVKDGGGLVWFDGVPDEDGCLSVVWSHRESPLERLRRFTIQLTVV
jgi:uncharacterized protein YciI